MMSMIILPTTLWIPIESVPFSQKLVIVKNENENDGNEARACSLGRVMDLVAASSIDVWLRCFVCGRNIDVG